jgi:hypothetical protein
MLDKYNPALEDYLEKIQPTSTQKQVIDQRMEYMLSALLQEVPDATIYAQGSFATDTQTKPLTDYQSEGNAGEYDVDLAIEDEGWHELGATKSLEKLDDFLESDKVLGKLNIVKTKASCSRVCYADDATGVSFHFDLIPTVVAEGQRKVPIRAEDEWKKSDSKSHADWYNAKAEANPNLRRIALILKRMRDVYGIDGNLKSITILTLITTHYTDNGGLAQDLLATLSDIASAFKSDNISIPNPVNPGEDLVDGIKSIGAVRKFFSSTYEKLEAAFAAEDADALREVFGPSFSYTCSKQASSYSILSAPAAITPRPAYHDGESSDLA